MNFTYDFPVIKNNPQKTASHKKIRRIGRLRLGDSYRNLRSRFELTPVKIPEDSGTEAYTLPMEKEILFHCFTGRNETYPYRALRHSRKKERCLFLGRHGDNRLHDR